MTTTKRTLAKQGLFRKGRTEEIENFLDYFIDYLERWNLREEPLGILFEYAIAFLLGIFQRHNAGAPIFVVMTDYLDDCEKVDFMINEHRLQVKIDWEESNLMVDIYRDVVVLPFFRKDKDGNNSCGIDVLREILLASGLTEDIIEDNIDNPAFDAAEEILSNWLFN